MIIKTLINIIKYALLRFCKIKFLNHKLYFVTVMKLDLQAENMHICFLHWNVANGVKFQTRSAKFYCIFNIKYGKSK